MTNNASNNPLVKFQGTRIKYTSGKVISMEDAARLKNIRINKIDTNKQIMYNDFIRTNEEEAKHMSHQYITEKDLSQLEEKIDYKIKDAVQPLESEIDKLSNKIDNLPIQFENIIYKEREYQNNKTKETQRYIWGTIIIGFVSIVVSVILHFV